MNYKDIANHTTTVYLKEDICDMDGIVRLAKGLPAIAEADSGDISIRWESGEYRYEESYSFEAFKKRYV